MRGAWIVLAVAATLRLATVAWLSDTVPYSDYFYYHEAGRLQAEDPQFYFRTETLVRYAKLAWWPPGYPFFLASLYSIAGPHPRVAVYVQVLLGVLTCAVAMAIAWRACGRRSGLAAGWLLALDPSWIFTTNLIASENLFVAILAGGLWLATTTRAAGRALVTGAFFGAGALVRAAGLCVPFVVAWWLWRRPRGTERGTMRPRSGKLAIAVLAGCFAVLAPWTVRNAIVAGSPMLICFGGGLNFYFGHNDAEIGYRELGTTPLAGLGSAAAIDARGYRLGWETLARNPLGFVTRGVRKVGALFAPPADVMHANTAIEASATRNESRERWLHGPLTWLATIHVYLLLALALYSVASQRGRLPQPIQLACWITVAWIAMHIVFWAQPRFRYPLDLLLALIAAAAWPVARFQRARP